MFFFYLCCLKRCPGCGGCNITLIVIVVVVVILLERVSALLPGLSRVRMRDSPALLNLLLLLLGGGDGACREADGNATSV